MQQALRSELIFPTETAAGRSHTRMSMLAMGESAAQFGVVGRAGVTNTLTEGMNLLSNRFLGEIGPFTKPFEDEIEVPEGFDVNLSGVFKHGRDGISIGTLSNGQELAYREGDWQNAFIRESKSRRAATPGSFEFAATSRPEAIPAKRSCGGRARKVKPSATIS